VCSTSASTEPGMLIVEAPHQPADQHRPPTPGRPDPGPLAAAADTRSTQTSRYAPTATDIAVPTPGGPLDQGIGRGDLAGIQRATSAAQQQHVAPDLAGGGYGGQHARPRSSGISRPAWLAATAAERGASSASGRCQGSAGNPQRGGER